MVQSDASLASTLRALLLLSGGGGGAGTTTARIVGGPAPATLLAQSPLSPSSPSPSPSPAASSSSSPLPPAPPPFPPQPPATAQHHAATVATGAGGSTAATADDPSAMPSAASVDATLRQIRNSAVGNKTRKDHYIQSGVAATLTQIVAISSAGADIRAQAAVVLGSLAHGSSDLVARLAPSATAALTSALLAEDRTLVESAVKSLTAFAANGHSPPDSALDDATIAKLVLLLHLPLNSNSLSGDPFETARISTLTANLIASVSAIRPGFRRRVTAAGGLVVLLGLVDMQDSLSHYLKLTEAVLDGLAQVINANPAAEALFGGFPDHQFSALTSLLTRMLKDRSPFIRLNAAACLVNMFLLPRFTQQLHPVVSGSVLPSLIRFFADHKSDDDAVQRALEHAPRVFARLVNDEEALQKAAVDGDAVEKLAAMVAEEVQDAAAAAAAMATASAGTAASGSGSSLSSSPAVGAAATTGRRTGPSDSARSRLTLGGGSSSPRGVFGGVGDRPLQLVHRSIRRNRLVASVLAGLAAVCSSNEECRKKIVDAKLLPLITACLSSPDATILEAACHCVRSLSRSVKSLRTALADADVVTPLLSILASYAGTNGGSSSWSSTASSSAPAASLPVLIAASAAINNMVLEFSPMQETVVVRGGYALLVKLTDLMVPAEDDDGCGGGDGDGGGNYRDGGGGVSRAALVLTLRRNVLNGLKNMLNRAPLELKQRVMDTLTWPRLIGFLNDADYLVQEEALGIVRNLSCIGKADIDFVLAGIGCAELLATIKQKLAYRAAVSVSMSPSQQVGSSSAAGSSAAAATTVSSSTSSVGDYPVNAIVSALVVVSHLAAEGEPKAMVLQDAELVEQIKWSMTDPRVSVRVAATLCILNLSDHEDESGRSERLSRLRSAGVVEILEDLAQNDGDWNVRDRASSALKNFDDLMATS